MDISQLELTIRSHKGLRSVGINTVEQLVNMSWHRLNAIPKIGDVSVSWIMWQCVQVLNGRMLEQIDLINERSKTNEQYEKNNKIEIELSKWHTKY